MGEKNTEIVLGVVIKTAKVGESNLRVTLLCAGAIKVFTATGVLKKDAKLKASVQLFTIAEFTTIGHKITGAHVLQFGHAITKDMKRYYLACAICEVVGKCFGAGFLLTLKAIEQLCADTVDTRALYTQYFTDLLRELGYDIDGRQDINTAFVQHLDIKIPHTSLAPNIV